MDVDLTRIVAATSKRMPAGRPQSMAASQTMLDAFAETLTNTQDRQQDDESFIDRGTDNRSAERHLSDRNVDSRQHDDPDNNGQDHRSRDRDDCDADSNERGPERRRAPLGSAAGSTCGHGLKQNSSEVFPRRAI